MSKNRFLAIAFCVVLSFSGYAEPISDGHVFFGIGYNYNFFPSGPIDIHSDLELKKLNIIKIGGYWEWANGPGNAVLGLEAGFSSGSMFGGQGDVDFIPVNLNAAYVFPLLESFYIGPNVKLGGLAMLGPGWNRMVFLAGARLEAELRFPFFPIGVYAAGGVDIFPGINDPGILPVIEGGIRFPRGSLRKSDDSGSAAKSSSRANAAAAGTTSAVAGGATAGAAGTGAAGTGASTSGDAGAAGTAATSGAAGTGATAAGVAATGTAGAAAAAAPPPVATVNAQAPNIIGQPLGASYNQNAIAAPMTVTAPVTDGGSLSYQWFSRSSAGNTGGTSLGNASGAQTASFTPPTSTVGTQHYYVQVTNTNRSVSGTQTAMMTSNSAAITVNPAAATPPVAGAAGTATSGATAVGGAGAAVAAPPAVAIVNAQTPNVIGQPLGASYVQNAMATPLTVTAPVTDGGSLSYQWFSRSSAGNTGGMSLGSANGAQTARYTPPTSTVGTQHYYVQVTNTNRSVSGTQTAMMTSNSAAITVNHAPAATTAGQTPSQSALTEQNRTILLPNGTRGLFNAVYFQPDTAVLIEEFRPILESVGRQLTENPRMRLLLRTYTAPFGTADGRHMVSVERARFCREYFVQRYNIASTRMSIETLASEQVPILTTSDWESYRCAELILISD